MQDRYTAKGWKKSWRSNTSHNGEYRVKRLVSSLKIDFILANKVSPYLAGRASMRLVSTGCGDRRSKQLIEEKICDTFSVLPNMF